MTVRLLQLQYRLQHIVDGSPDHSDNIAFNLTMLRMVRCEHRLLLVACDIRQRF